jgi:hypothetical protein
MCIDDEAETIVAELDFNDSTECDPSFGIRSPCSLPPNAFTAVMPKDLDEEHVPVRKPLPRRAPIAIPCPETTKALKPLPWTPPQQALIPTQIFGTETKARRVRVLPPPVRIGEVQVAPRLPSYGWIDAFLGLFRRTA